MPSKAEHISKTEHNENFATTLNSDGSYPDYRDWVVTAYFYSAVHYVKAIWRRWASTHQITESATPTSVLMPVDYRALEGRLHQCSLFHVEPDPSRP